MAQKKRTKWIQLKDGEWIRPHKQGHADQCCDCGLVHDMEFKIVDGEIRFRAFRNKRKTAAARRAFKFTKEKDEE
jgi:hypothetical protein